METSLIKIDAGKWSETANLLLEKISMATGVETKHVIEMAKSQAAATVTAANAEAEKMKILSLAKAECDEIAISSQIKIEGLQRRGLERLVYEEAKKQENIESIASKALPLLEEGANPKEINSDWMFNYIDKAKLINDEQMQELWAKILAGEANAPGKFSKRTISLLADMDKEDAVAFLVLCSFVLYLGRYTPLIYDLQNQVYLSNGLSFSLLFDLENIGLIKIDLLSSFRLANMKQIFNINYFGKKLYCQLPSSENNIIKTGQVILTEAGLQLTTICNSKPIDGFLEYVKNKWQELGYTVYDEEPEQ